MKKTLKKAVGIFLSLCLLLSVFPADSWLSGTAMAAANGALKNGELISNADGWNSTGTYGYKFDEGYLSLWAENAGAFSISQTVENMAAGDYVAKVAAVGDKNETPLKLTITNNDSQESETVAITQKGWDDNWGVNNVCATKSLTVAEGQSVTVTISGDIPAGEWYGMR